MILCRPNPSFEGNLTGHVSTTRPAPFQQFPARTGNCWQDAEGYPFQRVTSAPDRAGKINFRTITKKVILSASKASPDHNPLSYGLACLDPDLMAKKMKTCPLCCFCSRHKGSSQQQAVKWRLERLNKREGSSCQVPAPDPLIVKTCNNSSFLLDKPY